MKQDSLKWTLWLTAAGILSLVVRWIYWNQIHDAPLYQLPSGDAATYVAMAEQIKTQGILAPEGQPYQQAPFYGWFLALLNTMGLSLGAVRWVQYLMGAGVVMMGAVLGRRWGGTRAGLIAAFLGSLYGPWVFFEGELLSISVAVFLLMSGLVLWPRTGWAAGLCLGLSALTQPTIGGAGILVGLWALWHPDSLSLPGRRQAIIILAAMSLPLAGTLVRNISEIREPVVVSVNGGVNYYIGNNRDATGIFHLPAESGLINRPDGLFTSAAEVAESRAGRNLSIRAVDREWWLRGLDFWTTRPGEAVTLWVRKVLLAWNQFEIPNHFDYEYIKTRAPILRLLPAWGLVFPLAMGGMFLCWRRRNREPVFWFIALTLMVAMFFVTGRYRLPLTVVLVPAAGVFAAWLWESRDKLLKNLLPWPAAALALGILFAWMPIVAGNSVSTAHMLNLEGISLAAQGDYSGAERAFKRVLELNPRHAEALNNTGRMMVLQGRDSEALTLYQQALNADPEQAETYFNLEELYRRAGQPEDASGILDRLETARAGRVADIAYGLAYRRGLIAVAIGDSLQADEQLSRAVALGPDQPAAATALTQLRSRGAARATPADLDSAMETARQNPNDPNALLAYGRALAAAGRHKEAIQFMISAWQKSPKDPDPLLDIGASYLAVGDSTQAAAHWYKANEDRVHPQSLLALAALMEAQNKNDAAMAAYNILIKQAKRTPEAAKAAERLDALKGRGTP